MYPGLPTSLSGAYVIGETDERVQGRVIRKRGREWGVWYDDTTPDLEAIWLPKGLVEYAPPLHVMVCVPPGRPKHHYPPPIISVYEAYIYGMGCPPAEWLPLPRFDAYVVQKRWPGTVGDKPPSVEQFDRLLGLVKAHDPKFIWLF